MPHLRPFSAHIPTYEAHLDHICVRFCSSEAEPEVERADAPALMSYYTPRQHGQPLSPSRESAVHRTLDADGSQAGEGCPAQGGAEGGKEVGGAHACSRRDASMTDRGTLQTRCCHAQLHAHTVFADALPEAGNSEGGVKVRGGLG